MFDRTSGAPNQGMPNRSRFFKSTSLLALPLVLWTGGLAAQEPILEEEIVVTANRAEAEPSEVGSAVTVISRSEIELRNATNVAELLRTVPGLAVVRGGGPGQLTSVFMRGGSSSQTLVLIDGVRVNDPNGGAYNFADLSTDQLERIEIVRGPQSTLYGSEAVAGVIQLFTRRGGDGFRVSGLAEVGEASSERLRLSLEGGDDRFDWMLTVSDESTDGVSAASERRGNTELDPYENTSASLALGFDVGAEGRLDLTLRTFDTETANDGFDFILGPVDDLDALQEREGTTGSLAYAGQWGENWRQSVTVGFSDDELIGTDPTNFFSNFSILGERLEVTSQSDLTLSERDVLTLGLAYEKRTGESVGNFDESVDITSAFLQNAWSGDRFHLTAGLRFDDHSEFGDETTWRLATSWDLGASTRLHGSFGTGFKAPTLNDLFFPFFSNPDLVPETSEAFDIGIEHRFAGDKLRVDLTYFDMDFEDLIAFDFVTFLPQNIAEATSSGVELVVEYRPNANVQILASHTYNDTEDLATGEPLARRPESKTTLQLFVRPVEDLVGTLSLVSAADRIDSDGTPMDDYERVDLSLRYTLRPGLEPYLRVENLFDDEYEEIPGFTAPGSLAVVGLGFSF